MGALYTREETSEGLIIEVTLTSKRIPLGLERFELIKSNISSKN
jgi:hypothetical protein